MTPHHRFVLTGATGFLGRRVLARLEGEQVLVTGRTRPSDATIEFVEWDALRASFPDNVLRTGDVVLHMAAATGTADRRTLRTVNLEAVQHLTAAAARACVGHVIFVSSIAAGFADLRWYPYGQMKRRAEETVRRPGVAATVVRPTMILGPGSPVLTGLRRLATGRAPLIPGRRGIQVQPIHVEDVAELLAALCRVPPSPGQVLEVGGPERLAMETLVSRIRTAAGLPAATVRVVPAGMMRPLLALAEAILPFRLPVTAGQLASFFNDGVAHPSDIVRQHLPRLRPVADMLAEDGR